MSSRIFIKNLPKDITREKLVDHIKNNCPKAEVTDCNLKYTQDGVFRRFAYVGFDSEEDATATQAKLNGTFIRTTKIQVDMAADVGAKTRSWSKYSQKGKSAKMSQEEEKLETEDKEETKPPRTGLFIKMKGLSGFYTEKTVRDFFKPLKPTSIKIPHNSQKKPMGVAFVEFANEKDQELAMGRNKNYINNKKIFLKKSTETVKEVKELKPPPMWELKKKETTAQEVESISESGRLFVRNLWFGVTEEELKKLFTKYGPLADVHLPVDSITKKVKGFAHIVFVFPEHALKAYTELDYTSLHGRLLHILPGKDVDSEKASNEKTSFRKKKDLDQKAISSSSYNWNTLFLGANAVADAMAKKYNTNKSQILDTEMGGSVGVRVALGETQIVSETREFLISNGVALDAFSQNALETNGLRIAQSRGRSLRLSDGFATKAAGERSKTVILVKNLPSGVTAKELEDIFSKHGAVGRVVMPPSGITAVVEYLEPSEAKKGFLKLNFSKFRSIPLYLEWAPLGVFYKQAPSKEKVCEEENTDSAWTEQTIKEQETEEKQKQKESAPEEGSTIFVKNLNFVTTDEKLKEHFSSFGEISTATVAKKKDTKRPGELLSMGYGFVEFMTNAQAKEALKMLQNSMLDDHNLELKLSTRTSQQLQGRKKQTENKQTSSKILVRNIPFEATKKEIEELFKVFGELKFVRLPKKLQGTGPHRGFAFVDFLTKQDAKRAFNALCHSTHLYGRRLVLEWAEAEETVEDLRRKTAQHFSDDGPRKKRLKKTDIMQELE